MNVTIIKPNQVVLDRITKVPMVITQVQFMSSTCCLYLLHPVKLKSDNTVGRGTFLAAARLIPMDGSKGLEKVTIDLPLEGLFEKSKADAPMIKGRLANIIVHKNGCIHAGINGIAMDESEVPEALDFFIHEIKGNKAVTKWVKENPTVAPIFNKVVEKKPAEKRSPGSPTPAVSSSNMRTS